MKGGISILCRPQDSNNIPGSRILVIDKSGSFVLHLQQDECVRVVLQYLDRTVNQRIIATVLFVAISCNVRCRFNPRLCDRLAQENRCVLVEIAV